MHLSSFVERPPEPKGLRKKLGPLRPLSHCRKTFPIDLRTVLIDFFRIIHEPVAKKGEFQVRKHSYKFLISIRTQLACFRSCREHGRSGHESLRNGPGKPNIYDCGRLKTNAPDQLPMNFRTAYESVTNN